MVRSSILAALLPLLALGVGTAGCGSTVVGGGDGISDDDGSDGSDVRDGGPTDDGDDDVDPTDPAATSYVRVAEGMATLVFSSQPVACGADPQLPDGCTAQEEFELTVTMPAERLVVGTIDLFDPAIQSFSTSQGADRGGNDCWFGGGSGGGSIEILAMDGDSVTARVDMSLITIDGPATLDFDMPRCDPAPIEPSVGSYALGYRLELDGGGSTGDSGSSGQSGTTGVTTTGGGYEEDRFVVQIANHDAATCQDVYASPACPYEAREIFVSVPVSLAFAGSVIDLSDETIYVGSSEQGPNEGAADCWFGGGGGPMPGTMTFGGAGQGTMDVTFAGTGEPLVEGTHTITVCQ